MLIGKFARQLQLWQVKRIFWLLMDLVPQPQVLILIGQVVLFRWPQQQTLQLHQVHPVARKLQLLQIQVFLPVIRMPGLLATEQLLLLLVRLLTVIPLQALI